MTRPLPSGLALVWVPSTAPRAEAHEIRTGNSRRARCGHVCAVGAVMPAQQAEQLGVYWCDAGCWPYKVLVEDFGDFIYATEDGSPTVIAEAFRVDGTWYRWAVRTDGQDDTCVRRKGDARVELAALAQRVLAERDKAGAS